MTRQKFNISALLLGLLVTAIGNSAFADTVAAIVDPVSAPQVSMNLRHWCPLPNIPGPGQPGYPPSGILTLGTTPAQFQVQRTGGTYNGPLIGNVSNRFAAFCLEPLQQVSFANETYTLGNLSTGGTDYGGMGSQRASMIQELFGRFYPDFSKSISQEQAAAIQIATWEILREKVDSNCTIQNLTYSDLDVNSGDIFFNFASNGVIDLAQTYLDALDGTGPKASNLAALTLPESTGQPTQDLLVQIIPEPGTIGLLSIGVAGLLILRKRNSAK